MSSPRESDPGPFRRLLRVELLGTVALVVLLLGAYVYFFVDDHLEWGLEYVGGRLIGAQVDVAELSTGWVRPSLTVEGLAVTDPEEPSTNWIELDAASLALNLDALLRARVVVERARLAGIRLGTERARPGWVRKQGDLRWLYEALGRLLSAELRSATSGTVLGDALAVSSGGSADERWERLREDLDSPEALQRASETLEGKRARVDEILRRLPDRSTLDEVEREVEEIRSSGDGGLAGRVDQLRRIRSLADRVDRLSERVGTASADLRSTLGELSTLKQDLESSTAEDLRSLRDRVSLPDPSVEGLSRRLFEGFIERRAGSLHTLLTRARPYLSSSSPTSDPGEDTTEPPGGADRTFGARSAYPGFWLKELDVSGTGKAGRGLALEASVRHLSSDPARVDSPAEFEFSARPPDAGYEELRGRATLEASEEFRVDYELTVRGWALREWTLLNSPDAAVTVAGGTARFGLEGRYTPGDVSTRLGMMVPDPRMRAASEDPRLESLLEGALGGLGRLEIRASGEGPPGAVRWSVESNLGRALADGLRAVIRRRVERIREELERRFQREIGSRTRSLVEAIDGMSSNARGTLQDRRARLDELEQSLLSLEENRPALDLDFS